MADDKKGQAKRTSLTSRASKIPQRVSSFLRPSNSVLTTATTATTAPIIDSNEKLATRLGHMLWRQRHQETQQDQQQHENKNDNGEDNNGTNKIDLINSEELVPTSPISLTDSSTSSSNNFTSIITAHSNQKKSNYITIATPSLMEYADDFTERCGRLLCLDDIEFTHAPVLEMLLESAQVLVQACDAPSIQKKALQKRFDHIECNIQAVSKISGPKTELLKQEIEKLQVICQNCLTMNSNSPYLCTTSELFRKESPKVVLIEPDYEKSDQIDPHANWFRHHFVGKPYITLIGAITPEVNNQPNAIVSIIEERAKDFGNIKETQYRVIIRNQETSQSRFIVHESIVKEALNRTATKLLLEKPQEQPKRLRNLKSSQPSHIENEQKSRLLRAALISACPGIDLSLFKELSAEWTILSGLEKDLLKYDEIQIPKHYKFGVLMVKEGQTTEEQWFSNTGLTKPLEEFLNILGHSIELKGYKGYAAGLDTKTGESGVRTYKSSWNDQDAIFHVAPLMPSPSSSDKQHVFRKKHIGNDIVCIVFIQGNQTFDPKAIRSQFLHVYIIVRPEMASGNRRWRIEVIRSKNVSNFGPVLPSPPVFDNPDQLKAFLTLKLVSAENAALKSKKFFAPNNKARQSILASHIQKGTNFVAPKILRSASTTRLTSDSKGRALSHNSNMKLQRPRSFNNRRSSSRFVNEAAVNESLEIDHAIPPIPTVSRSTLLQDFKKGFTRKKVNLDQPKLNTVH